MNRIGIVVVVTVGSSLLAMGCRDKSRDAFDQDRAGQTTITSARAPVANEAAINRLTSARCDREAECSNVGPDKHFVDREVCRHEIGTALTADLNPSKCAQGISSKELDDCVVAVQREACNNAFDTISRLAACRTSDLCLSDGERPSR